MNTARAIFGWLVPVAIGAYLILHLWLFVGHLQDRLNPPAAACPPVTFGP